MNSLSNIVKNFDTKCLLSKRYFWCLNNCLFFIAASSIVPVCTEQIRSDCLVCMCIAVALCILGTPNLGNGAYILQKFTSFWWITSVLCQTYSSWLPCLLVLYVYARHSQSGKWNVLLKKFASSRCIIPACTEQIPVVALLTCRGWGPSAVYLCIMSTSDTHNPGNGAYILKKVYKFLLNYFSFVPNLFQLTALFACALCLR